MSNDNIVFAAGLIGILLLANCYFWLNLEPVGCDFLADNTAGVPCMSFVFDSHGISGLAALLIALAILELSFVYFCLTTKKPKEDDWTEYTLLNKFKGFVMVCLFYLGILPLAAGIYPFGIYLVEHFDKVKGGVYAILDFVIVIAVAILYVWINIGIAKWLAKEEKEKKKKEKKQRKKKRRLKTTKRTLQR